MPFAGTVDRRCTSPRATRSRSARRSSRSRPRRAPRRTGAGRARARVPSSPASRARPAPKIEPERPARPTTRQIEEGKIGGTTSTGRTAVLVGYGVKQTEAKRRPRKGDAARRRAVPAAQPRRVVRRPAGRPRRPDRRVRPEPRRPAVAPRPGRRPRPGQAAGPQARQGPRRRPRRRRRLRRGRHHHPRRRRGPRLRRRRSAGRRRGAGTRSAAASGPTGARRARDADPDQGRPQDDRPGDGGSRRSRRRTSPSGSPSTSPRRWSSSSTSSGTRSSATSRSPRCSSWPRRCASPSRRNPGINAVWDEAAQEIVVKHYVNLGIAAATPRGLLVPNIKDARHHDDAPARGGHRGAHRDRARGPDPAGRDERRHDHHHQRRRLRGRQRHADHQPGRERRSSASARSASSRGS